MFFVEQFIAAFFVKSVASFDDTLTGIPIIAQLTRGRRGKIAYSIGTVFALTLILVIVLFFSFILELIPYPDVFIATLILLMAMAIYFEILLPRPEKKLEQKITLDTISNARVLKLILVGFVVSFVTLIDDSLILTTLFVGHDEARAITVVGIYLAALLQIGAVVYFGERLNKVKYKKEMASGALVVLAVLVLAGII